MAGAALRFTPSALVSTHVNARRLKAVQDCKSQLASMPGLGRVPSRLHAVIQWQYRKNGDKLALV